MLFRAPTPEDAAELAAMHAISWRQTYPGYLPEIWIERQSYNFRRRRDQWAELIAGPDNLSMWVAETAADAEGGIVGFASWRAARDERFAGKAELAAIYVLRGFQKQQVGARLFSLGSEAMANRGYTTCYCWTLEQGPSCPFYERMGLTFQGTTKTRDWDGTAIVEIAMEGALTPR